MSSTTSLEELCIAFSVEKESFEHVRQDLFDLHISSRPITEKCMLFCKVSRPSSVLIRNRIVLLYNIVRRRLPLIFLTIRNDTYPIESLSIVSSNVEHPNIHTHISKSLGICISPTNLYSELFHRLKIKYSKSMTWNYQLIATAGKVFDMRYFPEARTP